MLHGEKFTFHMKNFRNLFGFFFPIFTDFGGFGPAGWQHAEDKTVQLRTLTASLHPEPAASWDLCTPVPRGRWLTLLCYHGNTRLVATETVLHVFCTVFSLIRRLLNVACFVVVTTCHHGSTLVIYLSTKTIHIGNNIFRILIVSTFLSHVKIL